MTWGADCARSSISILPSDPYVADAAVLTCFDHRISTVVRKLMKKRELSAPT